MNSDNNLNLILNNFKEKKIIQSLLFIGPQFSLKFSCAKELAKSLNCSQSEFAACHKCTNCLRIENLIYPDFHVYGKDSGSIKISDIHNLQKFINMKPYEARKKVFVLKDAHNLTNDAANCLLKTLEEPTKDSLIILTTSKVSKIFPTLISRCQRFYFGTQDKNNLVSLLENKFNFNKEASHYFAYFCEGREGLALNLKDNNFLEFKNKIIDLVFLKKDLISKIGGFEERQEFKLLLQVALSFLRDILFLKLDLPKDDLINLDRLELLLEIKDDFDFNEVLKIFDELTEFSLYVEQNINLKLIFDALVLRVNQNRLEVVKR